MTENAQTEIVEAARRYPSVEEIAALLRAHQFGIAVMRQGKWVYPCRACDFTSTFGRFSSQHAHQAQVVVAMWEELAREARK